VQVSGEKQAGLDRLGWQDALGTYRPFLSHSALKSFSAARRTCARRMARGGRQAPLRLLGPSFVADVDVRPAGVVCCDCDGEGAAGWLAGKTSWSR
jgi:hypothetical protein